MPAEVITIDRDAKTASITIPLGTGVIVVVQYAAGRATAPELAPDSVSLATAVRSVDMNMEWIKQVTRSISPLRLAPVPYTSSLDVTEIGVEFRCSVGDRSPIRHVDTVFDAATKMISVEHRPAFDLAWSDFILYMDLFGRFIAACQQFGQVY